MSNGVKYDDKDSIKNEKRRNNNKKQTKLSVEKFPPVLRIHDHTGRNEENYDWRNS